MVIAGATDPRSGAVETVIPEARAGGYRPGGTAWCTLVGAAATAARLCLSSACDWGSCAKLWSLWGCFSAQRFSELLNILILFQDRDVEKRMEK